MRLELRARGPHIWAAMAGGLDVYRGGKLVEKGDRRYYYVFGPVWITVRRPNRLLEAIWRVGAWLDLG